MALNLNTLYHDYVLDDIVVLTENKFVVKGIKGISEIFTTDLMSGYSSKENLLSEARYRPFSLFIFALEYQFLGANPFVSHFINVLLFALLIGLIYKLLQSHIFREQNKNLAFITCLLFVVHPIHTEVIANVKSRDELIAFVLLMASLISLVRHYTKKSGWLFVSGLTYFFLALLTRESAVTFIAVFPLILYFFYGQSLSKAINKSMPLLIVFVGYMVLRYKIIGFSKPMVTDVLNAPYLYATSAQAFATKVFVLVKYISLLIFPHPLSADYSYNQIPYIEINSVQFIFSFSILIAMMVLTFHSFKNRSIISFSILYFMTTISLVANFVVDIGTPLSERLLFQPSLAICIVAAFLFFELESKMKFLSRGLFLTVLILLSLKTFSRNGDWKNNETLFFADVISAPNSARTTLYALEVYRAKAKVTEDEKLKKEYFDKAEYYGLKSLQIYPDFAVTYLNLGFVYFYQTNYNKASEYWSKGYKLAPDDPEAKKCVEVLSDVFYKQGNGLLDQGKVVDAIKDYKKSTELDSTNIEAWYNLGGSYYQIGDTNSAKEAWNKVRLLDQNHLFRKEDFLNY